MPKTTYANTGSILLAILILMTILLTYFATSWQTTASLKSLACFRWCYEQQRSLIEGLLRAGITCFEHNYKQLCTDKEEERRVVLRFDPWPSSKVEKSLGHFIGTVSIIVQKDHAHIKAQLKTADSAVMRMAQCMVTMQQSKDLNKAITFQISGWSIHEA